jgi:SHOCT-like protein
MSTSKDERDRILHMIETGQVTAEQAAQLLDTLETESARPPERIRGRTLRVRATSLNARMQKVHMTATLPVSVIKASLRLGARLIPQLSNSTLEDLLRTIENGVTGRVLDLQDLEKGERLEIFVE